MRRYNGIQRRRTRTLAFCSFDRNKATREQEIHHLYSMWGIHPVHVLQSISYQISIRLLSDSIQITLKHQYHVERSFLGQKGKTSSVIKIPLLSLYIFYYLFIDLVYAFMADHDPVFLPRPATEATEEGGATMDVDISPSSRLGSWRLEHVGMTGPGDLWWSLHFLVHADQSCWSAWLDLFEIRLGPRQ